MGKDNLRRKTHGSFEERSDRLQSGYWNERRAAYIHVNNWKELPNDYSWAKRAGQFQNPSACVNSSVKLRLRASGISLN